MTFNMCIHKEIFLRNTRIGRSPVSYHSWKGSQLLTAVRWDILKPMKPPKTHYRKSASSSTMRMHLISSALKTHSLSDPYPLVMGRSFVSLSVLLTGFPPYQPIPLSLGLYSQKPCPSLQGLLGVVPKSGIPSKMQAVNTSQVSKALHLNWHHYRHYSLGLGSETAMATAVCEGPQREQNGEHT